MIVRRLKYIFMAAVVGLGVMAAPVQAGSQEQHRDVPACAVTGVISNGKASWYGPGFHGHKTANGEKFNMYAMTAAHKTLPLGTLIKVVNKDNGEELVVRINDRGPYVKGRILDLSRGAAKRLGFDEEGVTRVAFSLCT